MDLYFILRRMKLKKSAIVGQLRHIIFLNMIHAICKCHLSMTMMMAIAFSVSRYMYKLCLLPTIKFPNQISRKTFTIIEQSFESNTLSDVSIIKKQGYGIPRGQAI